MELEVGERPLGGRRKHGIAMRAETIQKVASLGFLLALSINLSCQISLSRAQQQQQPHEPSQRLRALSNVQNQQQPQAGRSQRNQVKSIIPKASNKRPRLVPELLQPVDLQQDSDLEPELNPLSLSVNLNLNEQPEDSEPPTEVINEDYYSGPNGEQQFPSSGLVPINRQPRNPNRTPAEALDRPKSAPQQLPSNRAAHQRPRAQAAARSEASPFQNQLNLDMGADRLLIKSHFQSQRAAQQAWPQTDTSSPTSTKSQVDQTSQTYQPEESERRVVTSAPTESSSDFLSKDSFGSGIGNPPGYLGSLQRADQDQFSSMTTPGLCYTPLGMLVVIVITMSITVLICFCVHVLIRHLNRHQFDLIESSRQLNSSLGAAKTRPSVGRRRESSRSHSAKQPYLLALFSSQAGRQPMSQLGAGTGSGDQCAFDNPYFRDERSAAEAHNFALGPRVALNDLGHQNHNQTSEGSMSAMTATTSAAGSPEAGEQVGSANSALLSAEQRPMSFIADHISSLHHRQISWSVKELAVPDANRRDEIEILGQQRKLAPDQRGEEETARRKMLGAHQVAGDLVAVDIMGQDFIGLGFDVCGNAQDGIYIRSLLASGPARESGQVERGDRIRCLEISFDAMTLQDARELLNCASPYRMRMLLEKGAALQKQAHSSSSSASRAAALIGLQNCSPTTGQRPVNRSSASVGELQAELSGEFDAGPTGAGGPINTTKNYIKKITNFVSPNSSGKQQKWTTNDESHPSRIANNSSGNHQSQWLAKAETRKMSPPND